MAKLHGLYMVVLITYPNWDDPPWTLAGPAQKVKTIIYIYIIEDMNLVPWLYAQLRNQKQNMKFPTNLTAKSGLKPHVVANGQDTCSYSTRISCITSG